MRPAGSRGCLSWCVFLRLGGAAVQTIRASCVAVSMTSSRRPARICRAALSVNPAAVPVGDVGGDGEGVGVDEDVDDDRSAGVGQRGREAVRHVTGVFDADAFGAHGFGDGGEVRVGEVGPERDKACSSRCSILTKSRPLLFSTMWTTGSRAVPP